MIHPDSAPPPRSPVVGRQPFATSVEPSGAGLATGDPRPTTVFLIRHGETDWNRRDLLQGTSDIPLNEAGRRQALELAERLAGVQLDAAYTSPLRRARETAEAVLARHPAVGLTTLAGLREICYGLWQGRGLAPAGRCSPGLEWRWRDDPWRVRFPGGETLEEVRTRASAAWERIVASHRGQTVLVSGHGHLNRVLLIHALGWPRQRFWEIEQPNGGCCVVTLGGASCSSWMPGE